MLPETQWDVILTHLVQIGLAFVIALPVGWDREQADRTAGLKKETRSPC